ncbi:MAG: 23S rRNA (pseudouridine(1915)-N(3))-methyltransferase RlmH [Nitrospiraceae bacterium]|nr:23S rRNA (pseudouridine(1915)-N(3))-methyltransferase RlmH [Nitrospiraceae bacterium]
MSIKIHLIWVGKTKEPFIREGIEKYLRLLGPYAEVTVTEVREEKGGNTAMTVEREGERIQKLKVPYVLLDEGGPDLSSLEFAEYIRRHSPRMTFVMGGAYGVTEGVRTGAQGMLALSRMTLTHEMVRVLLLEQLYRAFSIINKKGYHH